MSTKFMIGGNIVHVVKLNEDTALDCLPPKVYTVKYDKNTGYFLEVSADLLHLPEKIYGNVKSRAEKCVHTYKTRASSTGILLTGDKGTGKSLLTALLANAAITDLKLPVLVIKEAYTGEKFVSFIESIGECCLLFDEFGKMYSNTSHGEKPRQEHLLTLMDGIDKIKRLIILTENKQSDINEFLLGRPSRIYYHFRYTKLDELSIKEYCEDMKVSERTVQDIISLSRHLRAFSFDVLQTIIEEHLRFGSSVDECVKDLNINSWNHSNIQRLQIVKIMDKAHNEERKIVTKHVMRPIDNGVYVEFKVPSGDDDDVYINDSLHLKYEKDGSIIYETDEYLITTKVIITNPMNYSTLL